jgi:glycosyltransferase involved in cell wall biosynthesis
MFWLMLSALKVRKKTSVIYSHFALHGFVISLVVDAPVISFFHGPWARESSISSGEKSKKFQLQKYIERLVYNKSEYIHCASESFKRVLITEYDIEERKIIVVPLGVDLERFDLRKRDNARTTLGLDESDLIFVSVRRLTNRMGIADLIDGFSNFLSQGYTGKLFIIGRGPQQDEYEKQIQSLGMSNYVKILGAISDSDLPIWYSASDVSIVPSRDLEGFGLVALESLACGTPVLASRCGGLEEIIENWNPKFLFSPSRPDQIATKLVAFAKGELRDSSENCRNYASDYTWGRSFERIETSLRRCRILFLSSEDLISGAELSLFELVKNLGERFDCEVLIGGDGPLYKKFLNSNVSTKFTPNLSLSFSRYSKTSHLVKMLLKLPLSNYRIFREIRKSSANIVFVNTFKTLLVSALGVVFTDKRVIFWAHDSFQFELGSQFGKKKFYRVIFKISKIQVICNSKYTAQTLIENIGVIPAFILYPLVRNSRVRKGVILDGPIKLGICGRISEWKGQLFAIQALEPLLATSDSVILEILGSPLFGDDEYFEKIKEFIAKRDLSQKVLLLPFRDSPEAIFSSWDLSIHSSTLPEPFGRAIVESLMVGVPVLVPEVGGPAEIVNHGQNGLTYKLGDARDLYLKVIEFMDNPVLRNHLRMHTQEIRSRFNAKLEVKKFESWLKVDLD